MSVSVCVSQTLAQGGSRGPAKGGAVQATTGPGTNRTSFLKEALQVCGGWGGGRLSCDGSYFLRLSTR